MNKTQLNEQIMKLKDSWSYEFKEWESKMGSIPVEQIASKSYDVSYEMHRAHIFKLLNNNYAVVTEDGCSCYDATWAQIEVHPTKKRATESFDKWVKSNEGLEDW